MSIVGQAADGGDQGLKGTGIRTLVDPARSAAQRGCRTQRRACRRIGTLHCLSRQHGCVASQLPAISPCGARGDGQRPIHVRGLLPARAASLGSGAPTRARAARRQRAAAHADAALRAHYVLLCGAARRCRSQRAYFAACPIAWRQRRTTLKRPRWPSNILSRHHVANRRGGIAGRPGDPHRHDPSWPLRSQVLGDLLDQHSRVGSPGLTSHRGSIGSDKRTSRTYREL